MRSLAAVLLVLGACASSNKPAPKVGHARLEIYCPRPPNDRASQGACHAWGALYPVGCKYDDDGFWCRCSENHALLPPYTPAGEPIIDRWASPATFEWNCSTPPPGDCFGTIQEAGERPVLIRPVSAETRVAPP